MHAFFATVVGLWLSRQIQALPTLPRCEGPSITISSSADAESIFSCDTYKGDVIIDPSAQGPIVLDGPRIITGHLTAINAINFDNVSSTSLETVQGSIHVSGDVLHGVGPLNLYLPKLESAGNITISDVMNVMTPSLTTVAGAMGIYSSSIDSFTFPSLSSSGDFIELVDCGFYTNIETPFTLTMGALTAVGGDLIVLKGVYYSLDFPQLEVVSGSIQFLGNLFNLTMPSLTKVGSNARIQTASNSHDTICDEMHRLVKESIIEGHGKCSVTPEYDRSSGVSSGQIVGVVIGTVATAALALAAFYRFYLRPKRHPKPAAKANPHVRYTGPEESELPPYSQHDELKR